MKLLCDVCENAVASLVCCADEAALCSSCDARVHAANKLASKHQRASLLPDTLEPPLCDICQERSSFFFCVEDRALLCRDCDISIHSANVLAAKHRRFLLTGIKVGTSSAHITSQETMSGISLEQPVQQASPPTPNTIAVKKRCSKAVNRTEIGGLCNMGNVSKTVSPSPPKANKPTAVNAKAVSTSSSYVITKDGTLSTSSSVHNALRKVATVSNNITSSATATTISIQRLSSGTVSFIAPVLSSLRSMDSPNINMDSDVMNKDNDNNHVMELDTSPRRNNTSDYNTLGVPDWRLDELLTDLAGVCESSRSIPPAKGNVAPERDETAWYAELDFLEEHDELSPTSESQSGEEGLALVPEMPSPPTASGLVSARGKMTCSAVLPWTFDYLFSASDNDVSVVPDVMSGRCSSPTATVNKKRKLSENYMGVV